LLCNDKQATDTRPAHFRAHDAEDAAAALAAGVMQGGYRSTVLKRDAKPATLRDVTVFTLGSGSDTDDAIAEAATVALGTALTRYGPRQGVTPSTPWSESCWTRAQLDPAHCDTSSRQYVMSLDPALRAQPKVRRLYMKMAVSLR